MTEDNKDREDKPKIYAEEAKDEQTTHWDMDYMSSEEIEQAYRDQQSDRESNSNSTDNQSPDIGEQEERNPKN